MVYGDVEEEIIMKIKQLHSDLQDEEAQKKKRCGSSKEVAVGKTSSLQKLSPKTTKRSLFKYLISIERVTTVFPTTTKIEIRQTATHRTLKDFRTTRTFPSLT